MSDARGPIRKAAGASSANAVGRREVLAGLGLGSVLGVVSGPSEGLAAERADAADQPAIVTQADVRECARLRKLDLSSPEAVARQKKMPAGKICDLSVGRLICGSNLISMNMHARDLDYVMPLRRITTRRSASS